MKEDLQTKSNFTKVFTAAMDLSIGRFLVLGLLVYISSCDQRKELVDQPLYEGPTSILDSINTILSDSGKFVMTLKSPRQSNFEGGDIEWPTGAFVEYYDKAGQQITTMFSANYVYYTKETEVYRAEGNVVVRNYESGDELTTEELFWDEKNEEYYTEKFVTLVSDGEVHTGEGLRANQDFSEYQILNPSGTFTLENDPNNPAPRDIPLTPVTDRAEQDTLDLKLRKEQ